MIGPLKHTRKERSMAPASKNSFGTRDTLQVDGKSYEIFRLSALEKKGVGHVSKLPFSLRVLLENLLRQEDGRFVHPGDIEALASGIPRQATQTGNFLHARARTAAGFHGRACGGRISPRCAKLSRSWAAIPKK